RLTHPDGERATARAAAAAGTIMIVSMASTVAIEEIAKAVPGCDVAGDKGATPGNAKLWFQLYIQPDLRFTEAIVRRAESAGCSALVVAVDSPTLGNRERDQRNGFLDLPSELCCENLREPLSSGGLGKPRPLAFSPGLSWRHIGWLREITKLKIVLKGVMHP